MSRSKAHFALITGASSGIGLELAHLFAADGIPLILVARRLDRLEALKNELSKSVNVTLFACDLSDSASRTKLLDEITEQNVVIDYLVNNAGCGQFGDIANNDWAATDAMLQLNMVALSHLCRSLLPAMKQRDFGRILNIASTAAFQPGPGMAAYFASKAYVLSYSEALAYELKQSGVTATCLCPGATQTEFFSQSTMEDSGLVKGKQLPSAANVALEGYQAMHNEKTLIVHGLFNRIRVFSLRTAPRAMITAITAKILK
ncbi:MAG: SDR family oxidoreductase [Mariprofundus sp.]|nr:SDR family oxidoreductase [Mariprofundus sp.]